MNGNASLALVAGHWLPILDGDPRGRALYLRHYSSRPGAKRTQATGNQAKFAGPGEHMLLMTIDCQALFLWRIERYRRDDQQGVNCAIFRNESLIVSSMLIREACELAWQRWPGKRLFTFVNPARIRSSNPGFCFRQAGWRICGKSAGGLVILEILA